MAKFDARKREDHLNAVEIVRDFARKMDAVSVGFQHVFPDEGNGATLILHVGGQKMQEADMLSVLEERLASLLPAKAPIEPQKTNGKSKPN